MVIELKFWSRSFGAPEIIADRFRSAR
jgi:hypothetical protein